jgi:hypothetical protein
MKQSHAKPLDLGQFPQQLRTPPLASATEWFAGALAVIWVIAVLSYSYAAPDMGSAGVLLILVALFLPLALIFAAVVTLRSVRALRAEAGRLQASVDAMRKAFLAGQGQIDPAVQPTVARKLDEIAASARETQTALANFTTRRDANLTVPSADRKALMVPPAQSPAAEEPRLALGTPAEALNPALSVEDFIRAMNFPEGPDDADGFRALRAALENRDVSKLIRAAQDMLTLLSQDGIYMDDLKHDRARPDIWRRFARGERGRSVSALGGVRDRAALALSSGRLREDAVFRDAAHHFLRAFDRCLGEFEHSAEDADLSDLGATRTARAFMLLGRVMGTFD